MSFDELKYFFKGQGLKLLLVGMFLSLLSVIFYSEEYALVLNIFSFLSMVFVISLVTFKLNEKKLIGFLGTLKYTLWYFVFLLGIYNFILLILSLLVRGLLSERFENPLFLWVNLFVFVGYIIIDVFFTLVAYGILKYAKNR